jgi:hypothetical protein
VAEYPEPHFAPLRANKTYAREIHAYEMHTHEVRKMHTHEVRKMHTHEVHAREVHSHEGFCEDLARQNTVAHLSQLQLGFRRCRIWVSVIIVVS